MNKWKYYIHINKHHILHNIKNPNNTKPVVCIKKGKYKNIHYCNRVEIIGNSEIMYDDNNPLLPCGARVIIGCNRYEIKE